MCDNQITYYVPDGNYHHREVSTQCGTTDWHGDIATCESCLDKRDGVPHGYCKHGVRLTAFDCDCFQCEMGY